MTLEQSHSAHLCFVCFKEYPTLFDPFLGVLYHEECKHIVRKAHNDGPDITSRNHRQPTLDEQLQVIIDNRASYGL